MYTPAYANGAGNWAPRYSGYLPAGHSYGAPPVMPPTSGCAYQPGSNMYAPPNFGPTYVHVHHHYTPPQMFHSGQQRDYPPQPVHQRQIDYGAPQDQFVQSEYRSCTLYQKFEQLETSQRIKMNVQLLITQSQEVSMEMLR